MALSSSPGGSESRFSAYVEALGGALGHPDRIASVRRYCAGLLLPSERKSIEPGRVQATHQSLHHLIAKADWSDAAVLAVVRAQVLPAIQQHDPIQAWIIDDTGFPKKGTHSVGVARQYCGQRRRPMASRPAPSWRMRAMVSTRIAATASPPSA